MYFPLNRLSLAVMLGLSIQTVQAEKILMSPVVVQGSNESETPFTASSITKDAIQLNHPATADSASLLSNIPGVSINQTGGVSSFPSIRGLADDRLRIKVDGIDLTATCPNHMNPPLSYIPPSNIEVIDVYAGVSPVSQGGDSIGGSIIVQSTQPAFASSNKEKTASGQVGTYYRSNNNATGVDVSAEAASENASIKYSGSWSKADNYKAGDDFKNGVIAGPGQDDTFTGRPGHTVALDEVASTAYETQDHSLNFAYKNADSLFDVKLGYQNMPEQLYPNQRMDLLDNEQKRINIGWLEQFGWGELETRAYYETVDHFMDFGPDKRYWYGGMSNMPEPGSPCSPISGGMMGCAAGMPMYSESDTAGLTMKANYELSELDMLKLGFEAQQYNLDDYWTPSGANMWPNTFLNINNGERDRYALFAEWESQQNEKWVTTAGIRYEHVVSDADDVNGYADSNGMAPMFNYQKRDSDAFNARDHKKTDNNIDLSLLANYQHDEELDMVFGLARKVRSPNLYERYTWSTWQMAAFMNNFVGDGNGYVGNLDLKPETAYTISSTFDFHNESREWVVKLTPFYTYVEDYIDAVPVGAFTPNNFNVLQYENQSARLYGIDLSGEMSLGRNSWGDWKLSALVNYTNGENRDTGDNLYNIMPLNGKLTLNQVHKGWDNSLEWVVVDNKDDVNSVRNEIETAGYGLLNLRASHEWDTVTINFGVDNIFDRLYDLPTGGTYVGQGSTMTKNPARNPPAWGTAVPGMGRSIYAGVRVNF